MHEHEKLRNRINEYNEALKKADDCKKALDAAHVSLGSTVQSLIGVIRQLGGHPVIFEGKRYYLLSDDLHVGKSDEIIL